MNASLTIDWRFVAALGTVVSGVILSLKLTPEAAERVSTHAVDAVKEYASTEKHLLKL